MIYGKIINNQLLIHKTKEAGDKPIIYTDPPVVDEHWRTVFSFRETKKEIVQEWEAEHIEGDLPVRDLTADEALEIILGGVTV